MGCERWKLNLTKILNCPMNQDQSIRRSKFLSLVLRHEPQAARVTLDSAGWVPVDELLEGCAKAGMALTRAELDHLVATNPKRRFEYNDDCTRIRASQGHSVEVDLQYAPAVPPDVLYHGTATRFLESIRAQGLSKMQRHHVHLADETTTTLQVGARHGKPVLLHIQAGAMHHAGHAFFHATNGVWLVDHVPAEFIQIIEIKK
jgi:putative RNA 2'-phosphotransferase